jgi:hypothetical protein
MKRGVPAVVGGFILLFASSVYADICGISYEVVSRPSPRDSVVATSQIESAFSPRGVCDPLCIDPFGAAALATDGAADPPSPPVMEIPAAPPSLSLLLCGLGSLGAWRLGRAARNIHFGNLPEWYHSGAPLQIGHTFAADPDCHDAAPAPAFEGAPVDRPFFQRLWCEAPPIVLPPCLLTSESPRGPPRLSC